jgi:uncharacterized protein (TIGR02271 family)
MTTTDDLQNMIGCTALDSNGDKIGTIAKIYLDDQTDEPRWVTVNTGLFGTKENFAPLSGSRWDGNALVLSVTKDQVKGAPSIDADGHLDDSENDALYDYYGVSGQTAGYAGSNGNTHGDRETSGEYARGDEYNRGVAGDNRYTDDSAMTRSEERVDVGTKQVETGRARLRKYVVTEDVKTTVPVSREEVRLEREPVTDENRDEALSGQDITEAEHEVTLHADQPVVQKETVPVERVRLSKDTVTEDREVNEQVRKEQIEEPEVESQRRSS